MSSARLLSEQYGEETESPSFHSYADTPSNPAGAMSPERQYYSNPTPAPKQKAFFLLLNFINFVMALDFMIVFLTVSAYWEQLGGERSADSVIFATYMLAQVVSIPIVGFWLDHGRIVNILAVTISINVAGNILYGLAASFPSKEALVIGRLMTGLGAGNLICGSQYIIDVTSSEQQRASLIASYNMNAFLGRIIGPVIALVIMYIPESTRGLVLDASTIPAWITALLGILCLILLFLLRDVATTSREINRISLLPSDAVLSDGDLDSPMKSKRTPFFEDLFQGLAWQRWTLILVYVLIMVTFWGWYGTITSFAFAQYHYDQIYGDWAYTALFAPIMIGIPGGTFVFKFFLKSGVSRPGLVSLSSIIMIGAIVCLMNFGPNDDWRYWLGGVFLPVGFNMAANLLPATYSRLVEIQGSSRHFGKYLAVMQFFVAVARAVGTTWTSPVLNIHSDPSNPHPFCCSYHSLDYANTSCCVIDGVNKLYAVLLAVGGLALFVNVFFMRSVFEKVAEADANNKQPSVR